MMKMESEQEILMHIADMAMNFSCGMRLISGDETG